MHSTIKDDDALGIPEVHDPDAIIGSYYEWLRWVMKGQEGLWMVLEGCDEVWGCVVFVLGCDRLC